MEEIDTYSSDDWIYQPSVDLARLIITSIGEFPTDVDENKIYRWELETRLQDGRICAAFLSMPEIAVARGSGKYPEAYLNAFIRQAQLLAWAKYQGQPWAKLNARIKSTEKLEGVEMWDNKPPMGQIGIGIQEPGRNGYVPSAASEAGRKTIFERYVGLILESSPIPVMQE